MRSFVATGYFVPPYVETLPFAVGTVSSGSGSRADRLAFYRQFHLVPPRNYVIARLGPRHSLGVAFYGVDQGLFLIRASSLHGAYDVLRALRGFFASRPDTRHQSIAMSTLSWNCAASRSHVGLPED